MFTKNKKTVLFIIFWVINIIHIAAYSSESAVYIFSTQDIDSLSVNDTLTNDTLERKEKRKSKNILDSPIDYSAEDSILFSLDNKKVFLYGNSVITYQDMELKSAFIELDLDNNEIYAIGLPDSSGVITGNPVFTEKNESYEAIEMRYNFKTRKGIITEVVTEQSDGYLHAEKTKRQANGEIHLYKGKYTTCDQAHPHFYIALTKAKAIPNDKVISGPAYLVVEDVPLYFPIIPFGFFPSTKTQTSGIIVPEYGEENLRGFYLRGGGYYWAISDYMDLNLTGDFYTSGTSGGTGQLRYKKRYRFSGNLNVRAYSNASGDIDIPNYINEAAGRQRKNDYSVRWSHSQDAKANPYSNFSGSVNLSTSTFNENHTRNTDNYLTNTKQSNVSYNKWWPNKPFRFNIGLRHSQTSTLTEEDISFVMPSVDFTLSRQYPFRRKERSGKMKWYENIQTQYTSRLEYKLNSTDSLFFNHFEFEKKDFGYMHTIPLSVNFKFLKYFNLSPSLNYKGMVYTEYLKKEWEWDDNEKKTGKFADHTYDTLAYIHGYYPSVSLSTNPTLYGMYVFKKDAKIEAIRHVIDPSIGFSFVPDMRDLVPDYYITDINPVTNKQVKYSKFENGMYGTPTFSGKNGSISFSLRNNVEMKVKTYTDTTQETKKIKIIDNLNMNISYNPFANKEEVARWSDIGMSTSNSFFNNKLTIRFTGRASIYAIDTLNNQSKTDEFIWENSNKLFRFTSGSISTGYSFKSGQGTSESDEEEPAGIQGEPMERGINDTYDEDYVPYADFNVPWDFSFDYSLNYTKTLVTPKIIQTLSFRGNVSLTPKWKIGFHSGFDFEEKKLTYTTVNIYRDLHCFEARFNWVPLGRMRSYGFTIRAKSSVLHDLKWDKPRASYHDIGDR